MPKSRYVASKRDIIIFFIISIFYSFIGGLYSFDCDTIKQSIDLASLSLIFYVPQVIAIIINAIIKYADINNEKALKVTKILFNIFICLYFIFMTMTVLLYRALSSLFDDYGFVNIDKTLYLIQGIIV